MEIANILFIFMTAPEDASSFLAIEYAGTILEKMLANTMVITSWMLNTAWKDDKRHEDRTGDWAKQEYMGPVERLARLGKVWGLPQG